jgi:O-antigen/teichoic acid export membrane protein
MLPTQLDGLTFKGTVTAEIHPTTSAEVLLGPSSPKQLSIRHNFMWTLAGNVIYAACQWATIVLLAKSATPEVVGQFSLAIAVAVPITFLASFQLRVLYVTDSAQKYSFREMLGLRFLLVCLSMIVVVATCAIARYELTTTLIVIVMASAQLTDAISDTYYGQFQRDERMDRIAVSLIIRNILSATAFTVTLYLTHRLLYGVVGLVLGRATVLLFYDVRNGGHALEAWTTTDTRTLAKPRVFEVLRPAWNTRRQREMLWIASPLAMVSILVSINSYMPRYVLEAYLGRHELGIYSAINYIPAGCFMVTTALGYSIFARLTKLFSAGQRYEYRCLLVKFAGVCLALGLLGFAGSLVAGRQVLALLYRPEYAQHVDLLRWLMVVGALQCLTTSMQAGLTAASEFRVQVPLFVGVAAVSLIACLVLVPRLGVIGAALAILLSTLVQLFASTSLVYRTMLKPVSRLKDSVPLQM